MFNIVRKEFQFGQHQVVLETGRVARQANTVLVTMGGVTVLLQLLLNLKQKQVKIFPVDC
jgi:polyribonucleotide nucleotidyltransferase